MREGQANLLGGILQHSQSLTVGGTPGLGEIPLLKYLFSSQQTETVNDEIVFVLIPHLVRGIDLSPLNLRTIDTGTGSNVSLREIPQPADVSSALITRTGHSALAFEPSTPPAGAAEAANQAVTQMAQNMENAGENPAPAASGLRWRCRSLRNKVFIKSAAHSRCRWTCAAAMTFSRCPCNCTTIPKFLS